VEHRRAGRRCRERRGCERSDDRGANESAAGAIDGFDAEVFQDC
jgi:hypothetical protein